MILLLSLALTELFPLPAHADEADRQDTSETRRPHRRRGRRPRGTLVIETAAPPPVVVPPTPPPPVAAPPVELPAPAPVTHAPVLPPEPEVAIDEAPPTMDPFSDSDRPVGHLILRLDIGVGGGTDGLVGRLAPGIEVRPLTDWGIGASVVGLAAGATVPRVRGELDLDLRTFFDFGLAKGWLRAQLSGGPLLYSKSAYLCVTPLCGYAPAVSSSFGFFGAVEFGYWLGRGPGVVGGSLRVQADSTGSLSFLLDIGFAGDLSAPSSSWRR